MKKLYQEANPPRFEFISENETEVVFDYKSARCMSHVCLGLIEGCANHYGEEVDIVMHNNDQSGNDVRFKVAVVG